MAEDVKQTEHELEGTRERLGGLLGELSRRRHDLTDVRLQASKHLLAIALTGASVLAVTASLVALGARRRAARRRLPARARRVREAISRMMAHPERVGREPPGLSGAVIKAALTAAAASVAKRLVERSLPRRQLSRAPQATS
jgi:hypothetical protein